MGLYFQDLKSTLYNGSCTEMPELPDDSVQCVVTSPPYWGLRKYAGDQELVWGGTPECEHQWRSKTVTRISGGGDRPKDNKWPGGPDVDAPRNESTCSICGAWRGGYGLEPTVQMYVEHTVEILREIRRVLRKDGVVFWNIGDSYASGKGTCYNPGGGKNSLEGHADLKDARAYPLDRGNKSTLKADNLKPKDLCLIPFRVALAAQEDGWWVRSVIIWSKPNPMPESVTDRPTEAHEYMLMLTKSAKYYWDQEAVREPSNGWNCSKFGDGKSGDGQLYERQSEHGEPEGSNGRNLRSVWTYPTQGYPGAHFATYPEKLPETCIKASTPEVGCCPKCGKGWVRVVEKHRLNRTELPVDDERYRPHTYNSPYTEINGKGDAGFTETKTLGWQAACKCGLPQSENVPSLVLDPFCGSGTTLWVAKRLGRRGVGYELSAEYCALAVDRNRQGGLL